MLLLGGFPGETEADVDRSHVLAPTASIGHEHRAVDAAAGQHGDPTGVFSGKAHSWRLHAAGRARLLDDHLGQLG